MKMSAKYTRARGEDTRLTRREGSTKNSYLCSIIETCRCLFYTVDCSFQSLLLLQLTIDFIKTPLHVRLPFALNTTQKFPPPELLGPLLQLTSSFMI